MTIKELVTKLEAMGLPNAKIRIVTGEGMMDWIMVENEQGWDIRTDSGTLVACLCEVAEEEK